MAGTRRGTLPAQRRFWARLWHPPDPEKVVPVKKVAPAVLEPPRPANAQGPSAAGAVLSQGLPWKPSLWVDKGDC